MSKIIRGSCLCGGVRFEVEPPFIQASHCHCDRCRKHSGTAVCTQARVRREQFRLIQGEELIKVYGKGEGAVKAFCSTCGSSLFGRTLAGWRPSFDSHGRVRRRSGNSAAIPYLGR